MKQCHDLHWLILVSLRVVGGGGEVEESAAAAVGAVDALHLTVDVALREDGVEVVADVGAVGAEARGAAHSGGRVAGLEHGGAEAAAGLAALPRLHTQGLHHRGGVGERRSRARDRQAVRHLRVRHARHHHHRHHHGHRHSTHLHLRPDLARQPRELAH